MQWAVRCLGLFKAIPTWESTLITYNRRRAGRDLKGTRRPRGESPHGRVCSGGPTSQSAEHDGHSYHGRRYHTKHRHRLCEVCSPRLAGPKHHANENRAAKDETEEARSTRCENAGGSNPLGPGPAMPLDPALEAGLIVRRPAGVERDEQPNRKRDGPRGPVQGMRRVRQDSEHGSTEAQSKRDAREDCEDGPDRPHILLRQHVSQGGFPHRSRLGLHPRLHDGCGHSTCVSLVLRQRARSWPVTRATSQHNRHQRPASHRGRGKISEWNTLCP